MACLSGRLSGPGGDIEPAQAGSHCAGSDEDRTMPGIGQVREFAGQYLHATQVQLARRMG